MTTPEGGTHGGSFKSGLLFGLGFSLPFLILLWAGVAVIGFLNQRWQEPPAKVLQRITFTPDAGLKVSNHRAITGSVSLYVVGQVENAGSESWDSVRVQVRLFDEQEQVVGLCWDAIWGTLRPGSKHDFQVDCDKWDKDAFPRYKHYSVEVVDATPEFRIDA